MTQPLNRQPLAPFFRLHITQDDGGKDYPCLRDPDGQAVADMHSEFWADLIVLAVNTYHDRHQFLKEICDADITRRDIPDDVRRRARELFDVSYASPHDFLLTR